MFIYYQNSEVKASPKTPPLINGAEELLESVWFRIEVRHGAST